MKICNSPPNTSCTYQRRLARDLMPDEPDNGAQPGAPDAYNELCKFLADHLDPSDLSEAETLLRQFVEKSGNIGTDEPPPFTGRPGGVLSMDEMHRRVAVGAQARARDAQAGRLLFDKRFPGAARIRSV